MSDNDIPPEVIAALSAARLPVLSAAVWVGDEASGTVMYPSTAHVPDAHLVRRDGVWRVE